MEATPETAQTIQANWLRVQSEVAQACDACGRSPEQVRIVGVSKYVGPELTQQLAQAGCHQLGENRPQALWAKDEWFSENGKATGGNAMPTWHMIGHLQRNKIRRSLPMLSYLHSVDSLRLVNALAAELTKQDRQLPILVEVNVTEDESKTGASIGSLAALLDRISEESTLELHGLMAMSTHFSGGEQARREFEAVRKLRDQFQERYPNLDLSELSMGMSGDFREAIHEGATCVRIGSHLWTGVVPQK